MEMANCNSETNKPRYPTYMELGIITERPKRLEYAGKLNRKETYSGWQSGHHLTVEDLVGSGFYYAGYGDCARCFYCGGALRNWDDEHDAYIEHARWFPKCAYICLKMGQEFVNVVQQLNKDFDQITMGMVKSRLNGTFTDFQRAPRAINIAYTSRLKTFRNMVTNSSADPRFNAQVLAYFGFSLSTIAQDQFLECSKCNARLVMSANIFELHLQVSPQCRHHEESDSSMINHHFLVLNPSSSTTSVLSATHQTTHSSVLEDSILLEPLEQASAAASVASAQTTHMGAATHSVSNNSNNQTANHPRGSTPVELGIFNERPIIPEYAIKIKRQETFYGWPRGHHLSVEELAEAGFYYAGYGDCARCFYCGGGLKNWEDENDVFVEHARWFPQCPFIRQLMGQFFVDLVQKLNKEYDQIPFSLMLSKLKENGSISQLEMRNNQLRHQLLCRFCLDEEVAIVFIPCGHLVTCIDCGFGFSECLICRQSIKGIVRAFMS